MFSGAKKLILGIDAKEKFQEVESTTSTSSCTERGEIMLHPMGKRTRLCSPTKGLEDGVLSPLQDLQLH